MLFIMCIVNFLCAMGIAISGDWSCLLSIVVAAFCGIATYHDKYLNFYGKESKTDKNIPGSRTD